MRHMSYYQPPAHVSGYELDPEQGFFSVIVPEETVNLCTNPSLERGTTGWGTLNSTLTRTTAWQSRGAWGGEVTPTPGVESGVYFGTFVPQFRAYTASVDFRGDPGKTYYIWFADTSGNLIGAKRAFEATGYTQRVSVTVRFTSVGTSRRVYITRAAYNDSNKFYVDGLQIEEKPYATTYADGDQRRFVLGQKAYGWTGTPHASPSYRTAQTRSGGREVKLLDLGLHIIAIVGLGMAGIVDLAQPLATGGEDFQGSRVQAREFTLAGWIEGATLPELMRKRAALEGVFRPDLTAYEQPLLLKWNAYDCDQEIAETLDIPCVYRRGLEGKFDSRNSEQVEITFKQHLPMIIRDTSQGVNLGVYTQVDDFGNIGYRDVDGAWKAMGEGLNRSVYSIKVGPDGKVYAGGFFTASGSTSLKYVAVWDPATNTWSPLGSGFNDMVSVLAFGQDGKLYAGGQFTRDGANTKDLRHIAVWDGADWSEVSGGTNGTSVYAIAIAPDGKIIIGGQFTQVGGSLSANNVAYYDGSSWGAYGSGMNAAVHDIAIGPDGSEYFGGDFTTANSVTVNRVTRWNGSTFESLAGGVSGVTVETIAFGPDGLMYIGGNFANAGGVSGTKSIAAWNGSAWKSLGITLNSYVYKLLAGPDDALYIGGGFLWVDGIRVPNELIAYNRGSWRLTDVITLGSLTATIGAIAFDPAGRLYIGGATYGTTALSPTISAVNSSGARAYPIIEIAGPGRLWQLKNYTTGRAIYFKDLVLSAGERVTLDLRENSYKFTSDWRGDLNNYILPGSDLDWFLEAGENNVSAFMTDTNSNSLIYMYWYPTYWSVVGAVR